MIVYVLMLVFMPGACGEDCHSFPKEFAQESETLL